MDRLRTPYGDSSEIGSPSAPPARSDARPFAGLSDDCDAASEAKPVYSRASSRARTFIANSWNENGLPIM